jgi:hypothetical protein
MRPDCLPAFTVQNVLGREFTHVDLGVVDVVLYHRRLCRCYFESLQL